MANVANLKQTTTNTKTFSQTVGELVVVAFAKKHIHKQTRCDTVGQNDTIGHVLALTHTKREKESERDTLLMQISVCQARIG